MCYMKEGAHVKVSNTSLCAEEKTLGYRSIIGFNHLVHNGKEFDIDFLDIPAKTATTTATTTSKTTTSTEPGVITTTNETTIAVATLTSNYNKQSTAVYLKQGDQKYNIVITTPLKEVTIEQNKFSTKYNYTNKRTKHRGKNIRGRRNSRRPFGNDKGNKLTIFR